LFLLPAAFAAGQSPVITPIDATALVRRSVQHRLDEEKNHRPLQYLLHRTDERRDSTKLIIETKDGDVARLIAINGKPLDPDLNQAELARLDDLAQHPDLEQHRRRGEQKDTDRVTHLLSLLPDAFVFKLEALVPCPSGQCYRISFTPNPNFNPPDTESQLLRGAAGEIWIDQQQERLTRLDAHFTTDVDFGFGILARLNRGSTVTLEQSDIGGHDWELTGLQLHVSGKILLFKQYSSQLHEAMSHFTPAPSGITYHDAIQLLKQYNPSPTPFVP
jgi:hypothetical protein